MTDKRFIRTIAGEIYDIENDSFIHQDYVGKPIGYEDECIKLLNELHKENQQIKDILNELSSIESFWDSSLLQKYISKIANVLGMELKE